jgi:hypothetical protein
MAYVISNDRSKLHYPLKDLPIDKRAPDKSKLFLEKIGNDKNPPHHHPPGHGRFGSEYPVNLL